MRNFETVFSLQPSKKQFIKIILTLKHRRILSAAIGTPLHRCIKFLTSCNQIHLINRNPKLPALLTESSQRRFLPAGSKQHLPKCRVPAGLFLQIIKHLHNFHQTQSPFTQLLNSTSSSGISFFRETSSPFLVKQCFEEASVQTSLLVTLKNS